MSSRAQVRSYLPSSDRAGNLSMRVSRPSVPDGVVVHVDERPPAGPGEREAKERVTYRRGRTVRRSPNCATTGVGATRVPGTGRGPGSMMSVRIAVAWKSWLVGTSKSCVTDPPTISGYGRRGAPATCLREPKAARDQRCVAR